MKFRSRLRASWWRPSNTAARTRRESFSEGRARRAEISEPGVVLDAALSFLEARPRSTAEVRRRLTTGGYREELITAAIERLVELGMLDDQAFASQWVESRDRARPRGERALRSELAQRGVDRAVVDGVLGERRDAFDTSQERVDEGESGAAHTPEDAAAWRLLERRGRSMQGVPDVRARRQRAFALLARNGFDSSTATTVAAAWAARLAGNTEGESLPDD